MATIQVGEATVGYSVEGDGIPLLLYHGTTMDRTAWDMVRQGLPANTYRCVMVEFPGSGESSPAIGPLTVEQLVEQALAVVDHLGIDWFHVAGYSLGAVVALATASIHPDRVVTATSLCGWATTDARQRLTFRLWKRLIEIDPQLFMHYALVDGFSAAALAVTEPMFDAMLPITAGLVAPGSAAHLDLDIAIDIAALVPAITAPTLVIGALGDRWVDISHSRSLAETIVNARLVELPAGHLVIQELAIDVAAHLHEHMEGHERTQ